MGTTGAKRKTNQYGTRFTLGSVIGLSADEIAAKNAHRISNAGYQVNNGLPSNGVSTSATCQDRTSG